MSNPSVQVEELSFGYSPEQPMILKDLYISVNPGECLWIIGPNGCGKTTLAKIVVGILKPKRCKICVNGLNLTIEPIWRVAKHVAYAFQNPDLQFFSTDVWSEVSFGPKALGYPKDKCEVLTNYALNLFGLRGKEKSHPHDLNRSDRKRLGLASVFAMDTPIIILDEPPHLQNSQEKLLIRQAIDEALIRKKTLLVVTNEPDFIYPAFA